MECKIYFASEMECKIYFAKTALKLERKNGKLKRLKFLNAYHSKIFSIDK